MPTLKFRKTDVDKLLSTIKNDWVKNHAFQEDVVDNAFQRFQKRLMGWLTHSDAWTDDDGMFVSKFSFLNSFAFLVRGILVIE